MVHEKDCHQIKTLCDTLTHADALGLHFTVCTMVDLDHQFGPQRFWRVVMSGPDGING